MKRFLKNIGVFIIVAIIGYLITVFLVRIVLPNKYAFVTNVPYVPAGAGHLQSRLADVKNFSNVDFLILGSSHAYRGFDPRIFDEYGYSMFNLGSSAQTPMQSNYLLRKYFNQLKPSKVIIEVYPKTFMSDGVESSTDLISNGSPTFKLFETCVSHANIKTVNTFIYSFADRKLLGNKYDQPKRIGDEEYISGGYVATDPDFQKEYEIPDSMAIDMKPYQLKALNKMLMFLKANETPYILVQAPINKEMYQCFRKTEEFDQKMASFGSYYNYNEIRELQDPSLYYDRDHLNQKGVEHFNRALLDSIDKKRFSF